MVVVLLPGAMAAAEEALVALKAMCNPSVTLTPAVPLLTRGAHDAPCPMDTAKVWVAHSNLCNALVPRVGRVVRLPTPPM